MSTQTIAAIATGAGRAGIGVVRLSGVDLQALVESLTGRSVQPRRATLARFRDSRGEALDEGIVLYFPAPHSYTGEDVVELQAHGGPVVLRMLLQRCIELGARLAAPGEFTRRAFLNEKLDLLQAEGVIDLIEANTARAARCAVRSLQGEFSQRIRAINSNLIELRALVEATLDFPEEEVEPTERDAVADRLRGLRGDVDAVLEGSRQGSLLREGFHVVLAGQPNVGKSSLLNRLAGEDLAIVTDVPGTTRDTIRQVIDLEGVPAHVIDTAGLRDSAEPVERLGVDRAWEAINRADVILLLMDARTGMTGADETILSRLPKGIPCLRVYNKVDLSGSARTDLSPGDPTVWMSAKTGEGVDVLRRALLDVVGFEGPVEGAYLARERHLVALREAAAHLKTGSAQINGLELLAEELRRAQRSLNDVLGEYTADDLLGEIFSRFCIGK